MLGSQPSLVLLSGIPASISTIHAAPRMHAAALRIVRSKTGMCIKCRSHVQQLREGGGLRTGRGADGLPVEVVVPDLARVVELRCGAAVVESLHHDLRRQWSLWPPIPHRAGMQGDPMCSHRVLWPH
jgi:hypothetical protein